MARISHSISGQRAIPSPPSSHFHTTFTQQMEAYKTVYYPNPNKFPVPQRSLSNPPIYISPTIEEIEQLTLDSGPRHDMSDHILNDIYACTLWDHLHQEKAT